MAEELSVWLLPCREDREALVEIIDDLAEKHSAGRFMPHVTIVGALTARVSQMSERLKVLACQIQPFDVLTTGVMHGPDRFKAIFIELAMHDRFRFMRSRLAQAFPGILEAEFQPHISLIYKSLAVRDREAVVTSVTVARSYSFDEVAIVIPGGKRRNWLDVGSWRIVATYKLGNGAS